MVILNSLWAKIKCSVLIQSVLIMGLSLVAYALGPISIWETNDDVFYNLLFSGQLVTSAPEPHAVFVNFVLASFFTKLYTFFPHIPWYGYFHVSALLLSVWFLNYCYALVHGTDKLLLRIALSLTTLLPFLFLLQFTKTAMVLAVAGYLGLYLLSQVELNPSPRQHQVLYAVVVLLLLLSFTLRRESFLLVTLLCGGLMVSLLLKRKRAGLAALAVTTALILSASLVHKLNYGEEWKDFHALARVIGPILDYNHYRYEANQKVYADAGLSRNDYYFLKSWGHVDSQVYSLDRLGAILANATKTAQQRAPLAALQEAMSFPARNYIFTALGLTLLLLLANRQQYGVLSLCVLLPFVICTGILAWQGRFPTRVSTGIVFLLPWVVLILSGEMRKRWLVGLAASAVLLVLAVPVSAQYRDLAKFANYRQAQNQALHRLGASFSSPPMTTLVTLGASFPYEGLLPFESPAYLAGTRIVSLGGMNQSPVQKKQMADQKIDNLFASLSTDRSFYIVLHPATIGILKQYIFEHFRKNVNVFPVFNGTTFAVYRISS